MMKMAAVLASMHRWAAGERRETSLRKRRQPGGREVAAKHLLEDRLIALGNSLLRSIGADKRDGLLHELIKLPAGVDAADERLVGGSGRRGRRRARFEGLAELPEEGRRFRSVDTRHRSVVGRSRGIRPIFRILSDPVARPRISHDGKLEAEAQVAAAQVRAYGAPPRPLHQPPNSAVLACPKKAVVDAGDEEKIRAEVLENTDERVGREDADWRRRGAEGAGSGGYRRLGTVAQERKLVFSRGVHELERM